MLCDTRKGILRLQTARAVLLSVAIRLNRVGIQKDYLYANDQFDILIFVSSRRERITSVPIALSLPAAPLTFLLLLLLETVREHPQSEV